VQLRDELALSHPRGLSHRSQVGPR
jgi:hypothetical protein